MHHICASWVTSTPPSWCGLTESYLSDSELREWNQQSLRRTGSSQNLCSLLPLLHDTVCWCLCRNVARCQCAEGHLQHSPRVIPRFCSSILFRAVALQIAPRDDRRTVTFCCFFSPADISGSICLQKCITGDSNVQIFFYIRLISWSSTFAETVSQSQSAPFPKVRMSLTRSQWRGRARPRWQLRWDACSSAEGPADRRWAVSDPLTPPLSSYPLILTSMVVYDYHDLYSSRFEPESQMTFPNVVQKQKKKENLPQLSSLQALQ